MTWAACVVGGDHYCWGSTRDEAIDAAVGAELERRERDGDEPGPIRLEVHGGCKWEERSEDERTDGEPWSHWLMDWTSTERVTVEAP